MIAVVRKEVNIRRGWLKAARDFARRIYADDRLISARRKEALESKRAALRRPPPSRVYTERFDAAICLLPMWAFPVRISLTRPTLMR
jgi:hypothetical protein